MAQDKPHAFAVLMFLLLFNFMLWIVGSGLHIYNMYYGMNPDDNPIGTSILLSLGAGITAGAVIGMLLRVESASTKIIYSTFIGTFWGSFVATVNVFYSIGASIPNVPGYIGAMALLTIFFGVEVIMFILWLIQMPLRGMKQYV